MSIDAKELEKMGKFLKGLDWQDFEYTQCPDLPPGVSPKDPPTPKTEKLLEQYRMQRIQWREAVEQVKCGSVLFLKSGEFILVGHVNDNLSSIEPVEPDFDYEDIAKIAQLW